MSSTVAGLRQVDGLGDRAADERLHRAHHLDVAHVRDRALADGDVEHRQVLRVEAGGADDRAVLVDVGDDLVDLLGRRSRASAAPAARCRLTIVICPPPTSSLNFTSEKSGSTPVVSQSIRKVIVPVGASTVAWALR